MSTINPYIIGTTILLSVSFKDAVTGALTDPSTVVLKVLQGGAESIYVYNVDTEISKTSTGIYSANIKLTSSGFAYYRWEAGGVNPNAIENTVIVLPSNIVLG